MKVKCNYCGNLIDEGQPSCPNCGASMPTANRVASAQPKTIEELKQWYTDHNLPPENITRFFIGKDIKEPKAFGIYRNSNGDYVVYKNKASGERAIRYQGADEEYAVNELYQRLRAEIADQKANNGNKGKGGKRRTGKGSGEFTIWDIILLPFILPIISPIFGTVFLIIAGLLLAIFDTSPASGYYNYNGKDYYYQGSSWYSYDDATDSWSYALNSEELNSTINSDTYSDYSTDDHSGSRFEDSTWYDTGSDDDDDDWDSDSSWSSNSSWDSDSSWDSGGSDWDSDW